MPRRTSWEVSDASHFMARFSKMEFASPTSETARTILEPFLGFERLSSRRDLR